MRVSFILSDKKLNSRIAHKVFGNTIRGETGDGVLVLDEPKVLKKYRQIMAEHTHPKWLEWVNKWLEERKMKKEIRKNKKMASLMRCRGHIPVKMNRYNPANGRKEYQ